MKKSFITLLFIAIFSIFSSSTVSAKVVKDMDIYNLDGLIIGNLSIHDDYVVEISYEYAVKGVNILVCEPTNCVTSKQEKTFSETYFDDESVEIYLKEYFDFIDGTKYQIEVSASFKPKQGTTLEVWETWSIESEIVYVEENASEKPQDRPGYGDEFVDSATNAGELIRNIAIPVIYGVLVIVLVVKGVLLGIDITRYSDQPDVRKEKIKAFSYFGVAIVALAGLNTIAAFVTGLFG